MMRRFLKEQLPEVLAAIRQNRELFVPAANKGQVDFVEWNPSTQPNFEALNTATSAKRFFFPQSEQLVAFRTQGQELSILPQETQHTPFVLFGIRACDAKGVEVLDRVFLSDPVDSFYQGRREAGLLVTLACNEPEETCFCSAFGIAAQSPTQGDITLWQHSNSFYWRANTQKGEQLTEELAHLLQPAEKAEQQELDRQMQQTQEILARLPLGHLDPEKLSGTLLELFESPLWAELSGTCLGCGSCTFVCPTCQCYDIHDFDTGHEVQRLRCWDSCMYSDFTRMAHGNPRTTQRERFRQRFMHKLVYFPENNDGEYSCVGCGRCLAKCPVSLHIGKVIKAFGGQQYV